MHKNVFALKFRMKKMSFFLNFVKVRFAVRGHVDPKRKKGKKFWFERETRYKVVFWNQFKKFEYLA